ncbi:hypothetical protein [Robiginitalea sediminis]|uniref:hypothetical protein n=1 Tax=Robiginitalea sediminis TaxID=1982593 RepID=UPI00117B466D|nr:hypothetical protein [Robiginitalea sediminis]
MDKKQELKILEEIETSIEPEFTILPEYVGFDENMVRIAGNFESGNDYTKHEWERIVKYIVFDDDKCNKFLKPIIPHLEKSGITYLEFGPTQKYGMEKNGPKFYL